MASIRPQGDRYRVYVKVDGKRVTKVFDTKRQAHAWGQEQEAQLSGTKLPDKTFKQACEKWLQECADKRRGGGKERVRLMRFMRDDPLAQRRLQALDLSDFQAWRDARLRKVKPGSVARELNLIHSVLSECTREWRWLRTNPMSGLRWPATPKGRARGLDSSEIDALAKAMGVHDTLKSTTQTNRVGLAFLFAIETAMRSGEICALRWHDVHKTDRYVHVMKSKNGDARDVPLSPHAVAILDAIPISFGPVFGLRDAQRDALFRKARAKTPHADIHFHDSRSEAITRLSKKLDVLDLARVVGQRDLKSLMHYYRADASALAKKLG